MTKVCEWDSDAKVQRTRDMTPAEEAQRLADIAAATAPTVPQSVPMLNARLTLIDAGKMTAVRAYLDAIPGIPGEQAREYFLSALTMKRDHPLVLGIPPEIMSEAEKDSLFIAAGALDV